LREVGGSVVRRGAVPEIVALGAKRACDEVKALLLRPAQEGRVMILLAFVVLPLTIIVGMVCWVRVRAARRQNGILEAYAEQEIARARSRNAGRRNKPLPLVRRDLPGHRGVPV
jgi:hypothetical protein